MALPLVSVVEILEPIKTNNDGLQQITYSVKYRLLANVKVIGDRSGSLKEKVVEGALFFQPLYSVFFNTSLPDVTTEYRVRWDNQDYEILAVLKSSLADFPTTSLTIKGIAYV